MDDSLFTLVFLPVALGVIMVSLGLSLTLADFKRLLVYPRGVGIGLTNLLVVSPLLAFAIAIGFSLSPALAVGLVILGASPGGTMANMMTHLARGDVALSVTMTALSSVAAVLTVPLFLELATNHFGAGELDKDPSMGGVVIRVLMITVVPLSIGMYIRHRSPERAIRLEPRVKRIALGVFFLVVVGAVAAEAEQVIANLGEVAAAALSLNVAAMSISFAISKAARLDNRQATAVAMELGIHNATLAIAVAASVSTVLTIPAAVYSSFMFVTAGLFARFMYRRNAREPIPAPA